MTEIARKLTERRATRGSRGHCKLDHFWTHQQVSSILRRPFYIGKVEWGKTKVLRNAKGRVKQVPVPEADWVRVLRPDLRIISDEKWEKAKTRLEELLNIFGSKCGQKKRGPRVHHSSVYTASEIAPTAVGTGRSSDACCVSRQD